MAEVLPHETLTWDPPPRQRAPIISEANEVILQEILESKWLALDWDLRQVQTYLRHELDINVSDRQLTARVKKWGLLKKDRSIAVTVDIHEEVYEQLQSEIVGFRVSTIPHEDNDILNLQQSTDSGSFTTEEGRHISQSHSDDTKSDWPLSAYVDITTLPKGSGHQPEGETNAGSPADFRSEEENCWFVNIRLITIPYDFLRNRVDREDMADIILHCGFVEEAVAEYESLFDHWRTLIHHRVQYNASSRHHSFLRMTSILTKLLQTKSEAGRLETYTEWLDQHPTKSCTPQECFALQVLALTAYERNLKEFASRLDVLLRRSWGCENADELKPFWWSSSSLVTANAGAEPHLTTTDDPISGWTKQLEHLLTPVVGEVLEWMRDGLLVPYPWKREGLDSIGIADYSFLWAPPTPLFAVDRFEQRLMIAHLSWHYRFVPIERRPQLKCRAHPLLPLQLNMEWLSGGVPLITIGLLTRMAASGREHPVHTQAKHWQRRRCAGVMDLSRNLSRTARTFFTEASRTSCHPIGRLKPHRSQPSPPGPPRNFSWRHEAVSAMNVHTSMDVGWFTNWHNRNVCKLIGNMICYCDPAMSGTPAPSFSVGELRLDPSFTLTPRCSVMSGLSSMKSIVRRAANRSSIKSTTSSYLYSSSLGGRSLMSLFESSGLSIRSSKVGSITSSLRRRISVHSEAQDKDEMDWDAT